jgi:2-dehydro-3-deoxygluconokinase
MLRLDPGDRRIRTTRGFSVWDSALNTTWRGLSVRLSVRVARSSRPWLTMKSAGGLKTSSPVLVLTYGLSAGTGLFHTGGIMAGLSKQAARTTLSLVRAAKASGAVVSNDLNCRPSLWQAMGGTGRCRKVNRALAGPGPDGLTDGTVRLWQTSWWWRTIRT